ncbi:MAG: hypothetical protein AMQ22_00927 [Candidatus Methanofastidiosum methylothiophilum]|uniref:Uncharacterized protein n=1 Tax=Candidatus Methanofastidiosum methylothiophilum TaxID=1705564 RepID=A0A150J4Q6_9EURY|nr:MAG: hypothetical protein AMQ22_00927 [Candidatus Methanofastidiosum methylthiophilus]
MTVKDIMDRVSMLYNDAGYDRVPQETYLKFLDDTLSQLVLSRPDSHVMTDIVLLDSDTRQELPKNAQTLICIYRNMGNDGITKGAPVWQVNRKDLDYFSDWHTDTGPAPTAITEYAYDPKSPRIFWVSPSPQPGTNIYVEMDYSIPFDKYSDLDWNDAIQEVIPVDDVFINPICNYMLFLLYSTDAASKNDKITADQYRRAFYADLGLEQKAMLVSMPFPGNTPIFMSPKEPTANG